MAFLKSFRGNGDQTDTAKAELEELATRLQGERHGLEQLINRAQGSSKALGKLTDPVARMSDRLAALERQIGSIEERLPTISTAQDRAREFLASQQRIDSQLGTSTTELERLQARVRELERLVETAGDLERNLARFLELGGPFRALQIQADDFKERMAAVSDDVGRLQQHHEGLAQSSSDAANRLDAIDGATQTAARAVEECRRRAEEIEHGVARLTQLAAGAADARRQLLSLKSLADQVTQKTAALENQRDAVERVARDVSRLDDLVRRVDGAIRQQEDQISSVHTLATDVGDLKALYDSVAARSEEISTHQQEVEEQQHATRQALSDLGEQLRRATDRFELERRGLETVSHRITDLRAVVKDCEERMAALDTSARGVAELQGKADKLWTRVGFLTGEVATLNEAPERIRVLRGDAQRLQDFLQNLTFRVSEIEKAQPAVEAVTRDLATLGRTHEAIRDALDQMRAAHDEVATVRTEQAETATWLKTVQQSVAEVQERADRIDAVRSTIEAVQRDAERVVGAIDVVASRRQFLDETQTRLAELAALGAQLDDRTKAFRSRLDVAEGRFVSVTRQSEDAGRIASLMTTVSGAVSAASRQTTEVVRSITSLEDRAQNLESIAERVRQLGVELDQRQGALEKASAHLARAGELRQDAAAAVQQLEERSGAVHQVLAALDERGNRLETLSRELDGHSSRLGTVAKSMEHFDEQLRGWEVAKLELQRTLEQVASRQSTVNALQANIGQMFAIAESTAGNLKAAVEAQREIRESKASLEELLQRLRDADAATSELARRQQEIELAEQRLGRAEALLIDIQSSLETLNNQKATLDRMMVQAGTLGFQIQQGEALIDRLRNEREITTTVRTALEDPANRGARPGNPFRRGSPENQ